MRETWLPLGSSDPLSYTCTCPCSTSQSSSDDLNLATLNPGQVLLFYRYFASPPTLPTSLLTQSTNPSSLAAFHTSLTQTLSLGGKIRVAKEGFNITVGGTSPDISTYIQECLNHWSFSGLESDLDTEDKRRAFFKPSPGCACVFGGAPASVRVCSEITPMGVTDYVPKDWDVVQSLSPAEFHERCWGRDSEGKERRVLIDVRNYYESRIGFFVDPVSGREAVRPGVRRFGQWPQFVKNGLLDGELGREEGGRKREGKGEGTQYLTYCTGGIRCEKGARFLAENLPVTSQPGGRKDSVCTLKGGIQAYLMWMDEEIKADRKTADESLFKGKNYVFDGRGSTGLECDGDGEKVAQCYMCKKPEDRMSKCRSRGCHLILVVCEQCKEGDVRCCGDCEVLDGLATEKESKGPRPICACEKERELKLWGDRPVKLVKTLGGKVERKPGLGERHGINIQIKTID